jgi:hypothetical protein
MSLQASVGFQIPTNVVEVGNEITADQLAAINAASNAPSAGNPFATNAFVTGQGYVTGVPIRGINTGTTTIDEGDNNYIYVINNGDTLTIDDEINNNPPVGIEVPVVSTSGNGTITCLGSVTVNNSSGFTLPSYTVLKLVKIASNTWWIG